MTRREGDAIPWFPRREGEATTEYLARALESIPLISLAANARLGHYDDYFCPPEVDDGMNIHRLVADIQAARRSETWSLAQDIRMQAIVKAAKEGEFDGTREESGRWFESKDGQATFRMLVDGK